MLNSHSKDRRGYVPQIFHHPDFTSGSVTAISSGAAVVTASATTAAATGGPAVAASRASNLIASSATTARPAPRANGICASRASYATSKMCSAASASSNIGRCRKVKPTAPATTAAAKDGISTGANR
jgi:hypothetical protein